MPMKPAARLSHRDPDGLPRMVDVSAKTPGHRIAMAAGTVRCTPETARLIAGGGVSKGDVTVTAQLAGILAAKRTAGLIPMCHPLSLDHVEVSVVPDAALPGVQVTATVRCTGRTGVEMEALTAVTVAALTVIDMAKSSDPWMTIDGVGLISKRGGRSGVVSRPRARATAGDR
jgi:cyclic pyranopterin phosphate synthase